MTRSAQDSSHRHQEQNGVNRRPPHRRAFHAPASGRRPPQLVSVSLAVVPWMSSMPMPMPMPSWRKVLLTPHARPLRRAGPALVTQQRILRRCSQQAETLGIRRGEGAAVKDLLDPTRLKRSEDRGPS
jgi:hypothetical protein